MNQTTVFCPSCGANIELSEQYQTQFCPYCGKPMKTEHPTFASMPVHEEPRTTDSAYRASTVRDELHDGQEKPRKKRRALSSVRWLLTVIVWAAAWFVLLYVALEVANYLTLSLGVGLLLLASMPFWFPRFHPNAADKKGVRLIWTVIMLLILAAAYFVIEELL